MKTTKAKAAIAYMAMVVAFYLDDCFIAHPTHPEVPWIASGVYCGGPLGFVATVAVAIVCIGYCVKKGY